MPIGVPPRRNLSARKIIGGDVQAVPPTPSGTAGTTNSPRPLARVATRRSTDANEVIASGLLTLLLGLFLIFRTWLRCPPRQRRDEGLHHDADGGESWRNSRLT